LLSLGGVCFESGRIDLASISWRSLLAVAYLIVFGSLIAFSAYIWLLSATTPAKLGTYAYVNPVVAVLLGWAIASEPVASNALAGMSIIVVGLILITRARIPVAARPSAPPNLEAEELPANFQPARRIRD
jgi:drug/metabolite transporter (DMT)-like permease